MQVSIESTIRQVEASFTKYSRINSVWNEIERSGIMHLSKVLWKNLQEIKLGHSDLI